MKLRLRIALALAASFVVAGAIVLAVSAVTFQRAVYATPAQQNAQILKRYGATRADAIAYLRLHPEAALSGNQPGPAGGGSFTSVFRDVQRQQQNAAVERARYWTLAAFGLLAALAGLVGWLIAGRALRPLRSITARARSASPTDLSDRVALDGPNDEVRELGDTFDEMLDRLESAFVAQRAFAAQVSHELRTPLSVIAAETDLLADDGVEDQAHSLDQIRAATERAEKTIAALLVLSRSSSGDISPTHLDLGEIAGDSLGELVHEPAWRNLRVELDLEAAPVYADPVLLERLVANVLSNAVRHNQPGGWIDIRSTTEEGWSVLRVENSAAADRNDDGARPVMSRGEGIGLTIIESVLVAHGGSLVWDDAPGRVAVSVRLPAVVRALSLV
jgi:signal transduction histidine kinase